MSGLTIKSDGEPKLTALVRWARELGGEVAGAGALTVAGRAIANILRAHFTKLANDSQHHETADSLGAKRSGFYDEARRGVQQPVIEGDAVAISINKAGLRQRLFGGTIKPRNAKRLTIPARAEAYGHRASEFDNLRAVIFPSGVGALVEETDDADESDVYFWLVKSVTQKPDPTVLPEEGEMIGAAIAAVGSFVDRINLRRAA